MDILIFALDDSTWAFGTPDAPSRTLAPFGIDGAFLSYRLWRDATLHDEQWNAAKDFFLRLAGDLRKPGRRVSRKASAA